MDLGWVGMVSQRRLGHLVGLQGGPQGVVNVSDETYNQIVNISKDQDLNLINCFIYEGINLPDLKKIVSWMIF